VEKILVDIYIPALNKSYDVYLSLSSKIHEAEVLLANAIKDISDGYFVSTQDTVLCDRVTGNILDINKSATELGLQNGSKLMLI